MSFRAQLPQQFGNSPTARAILKRSGLAALLAAGVSIFAVPADATVITSATGNCGTGSIASTGTTASQLIIGCVATGSLEVNASSAGNGLTTATAGYTGGSIGLVSGYFTGSNGSVLVNGNGTAGSATLNITRAVEVGFSGGTGSLTVQNGGTAQVMTSGSEITIANSSSTGTATVDGANSLLSSGSRIYVGSFSNAVGSLTVSNGGRVQSTVAPGGFIDGALVIGAASNASGTVTVTGANSVISTNGLIVGDNEAGSTGSLTIQNGGAVNATVLADGTGAGLSIGAASGATVTVTGAGSSLNVAPVTSGFIASKEVNIGGFATGTLIVDQSASVNAAGTNVHVSGGAIGTQTGAAGLLTVKTGATLTADTVTVYQNGTLNGTGTIAADVVLNGGTLAPGNSPGTINVLGDLDLLSGNVSLEIGPGISDHFDVSGNVTIGKDVIVTLVFETTPSFDQVFDLESFFTHTGGFDFDPAFNLASQISVSGLAGGSSIFVMADGQRTGFSSPLGVPEPASIAFLLAGLGGLAAMRRRRKPAV
jgi:T5SS/PEP-CTERM-associated repeat protein